MKRVHFTVKILFNGFDNVQSVVSFEILNDMIIDISLNL